MRPLVLVTWTDALKGEGSVDDILPGKIGVTRKTVGWLVSKRKDGVVIAMSCDENAGQAFERWFTIPNAYVVKIEILERKAAP